MSKTNILFVNAYPITKVEPIVEELKAQKISFTAEVCTSAHQANRYVKEHGEEIEFVVIDTEIPYHNGREAISPLTGMSVIDLALSNGKNLKKIIVTTGVKLPLARMVDYNAHCDTSQVERIDGKWLAQLIRES